MKTIRTGNSMESGCSGKNKQQGAEEKKSFFFFFHRGCEKPVFRTWAKSVLCTYLNNYFPWWKKLYSYLGHLDFLSRIPFQPSGKALALKSYPRKKKKASAVRNYYLFFFSCDIAVCNNLRQRASFFLLSSSSSLLLKAMVR